MRMWGAVGVLLVVAMPVHAAVICQKRNGAMFVREACKKKETAVDLAAFGAVGPAGPAGAPGVAGADATALWAVVNADGTLARGSGVVSSAKLAAIFIASAVAPLAVGDGSYEVIFDRDVTGCAYTATLGTATLGPPPPRGGVIVEPRAMNANGVYVGVYDGTGADADGSFHLAVFCP